MKFFSWYKDTLTLYTFPYYIPLCCPVSGPKFLGLLIIADASAHPVPFPIRHHRPQLWDSWGFNRSYDGSTCVAVVLTFQGARNFESQRSLAVFHPEFESSKVIRWSAEQGWCWFWIWSWAGHYWSPRVPLLWSGRSRR